MDTHPWPAPPDEHPVRISDPGEIAAGLPHLLGFHPHESVVLIGLTGPSGSRVGLCARADLPPPPLAARVAAGLAEAVASSSARAALVAVVSEAPDRPLFDDPEVAAGLDLQGVDELPHRDLVHEVVLTLDDAGIAVREALLVRDGRWWSYDCPHACCAPGGGTPLPGGVPALHAASVAAGQVLAADRAELAARVAAPDGPAAAAAADAALEVGRALAAEVSARGSGAVGERSWSAVLAGLATLGPRPGGGRLTDREVARIGWGLRDVIVRDRALQLALGPDASTAELLWTECTRRLPAPLDAAPATLLAVSAWLRGDGATANVALDRALAGDPGYRLAELLGQALAACVPPDVLRATLLGSLAAEQTRPDERG